MGLLLELPSEIITQIFRYAVVEPKTSTTYWLRTTVPLVDCTTKDVRIIFRASTDNLRICKALQPNVLDSLTLFIHIDSPKEFGLHHIRSPFLKTEAEKRLAKIRHCKLYITSTDFDPTHPERPSYTGLVKCLLVETQFILRTATFIRSLTFSGLVLPEAPHSSFIQRFCNLLEDHMKRCKKSLEVDTESPTWSASDLEAIKRCLRIPEDSVVSNEDKRYRNLQTAMASRLKFL